MVLTIRPPAPGADAGGDDSSVAAKIGVRRAALPLFAERGYEGVTADDLARASGVSRRTFFRLFDGKHQVVSADHEVFFGEVAASLGRTSGAPTIAAAGAALRLVLESFTAVRDETVLRDRLIQEQRVLLAEELRWSERYQRLLATYLTPGWRPGTTMQAEVASGGLVAALGKALRDWLDGRGEGDPGIDFDAAVAVLSAPGLPGARRRVAVLETDWSVEEIEMFLRTRPGEAGAGGVDRD